VRLQLRRTMTKSARPSPSRGAGFSCRLKDDMGGADLAVEVFGGRRGLAAKPAGRGLARV